MQNSKFFYIFYKSNKNLVWKTQTNSCRKPIHWALKKKKEKKIIGHDRVPLPLTSPLADVFGIDPKVFSHAPVS
jgi:hypothetical protein